MVSTNLIAAALMGLLLAFAVAPEVKPAPDASKEHAPPSVGAIRIGATDVDVSSEFYCKHLGCTQTRRDPSGEFAVLDNDGVRFVLSKVKEPIAIARPSAYVRLNFKTKDLDRKSSELANAGISIGEESKSGVGRFRSFTDPSGNPINLKQLTRDEAAYETPRFYDVGIGITDLAKGEKFYGETLGFEVMTRKFYPPVIPYTQRGCAFFIISDDAKGTATYVFGRTAWTGMLFEVPDLEKEAARLSKGGVEFLESSPRSVGPYQVRAFKDPFGNIHELAQQTK